MRTQRYKIKLEVNELKLPELVVRPICLYFVAILIHFTQQNQETVFNA